MGMLGSEPRIGIAPSFAEFNLMIFQRTDNRRSKLAGGEPIE
jgi:hypothetical protein